MKINHNVYRQTDFEPRFRQSKIYKRLEQDFDVISFEKLYKNPRPTTPRQIEAKAIPESIFSAVPFYYLGYLLDTSPSKIYDIGCGWNIFKKYIPNIIGIGAELPESGGFYGDLHNHVNEHFVRKYQNFFPAAFSINALHYRPLSDIQEIVKDFHSMLKPGGRGWLTLNIARMIELDLENFMNKSSACLEVYVRNELDLPDIDFIVFDVDLSILDEYMNGNIRLVIQKGNNHA